MSKRKTEKLIEEIRRLADCFSEDEGNLTAEELAARLRECGVDPDELRSRFHSTVKRIAQRERMANRSISPLLNQAIDSTRPATDLPRDPIAARKVADTWLGAFLAAFELPENLEACRAYRKSGDVSEAELDDLDRLEDDLKRKVKEESERKG